MFYRRNLFDEIFKEFESMFDNVQPTYYKIGPNGFVLSYSNFTKEDETEEITKLKSELEMAVENQEFEKAVELRDKIKSLEENGEKINSLEIKLKQAIEKQDFEKAIELRDEIKNLKS